MKIASIAAGAGGMYCGSCLRDNTLAARLLAAGHEVTLIPLYTPMRTDEESVSERRVFLGGINIYLQEHSRVFRSTPAFVDRILDLNPILRFATRRALRVDPASLGRLTVSTLMGREGNQRKEIRRLVRFLRDEVQPEIVNLPNTLLIALAPAIKEVLDIPVCCTVQGEDLFLEGLREPYRSDALGLIRRHAGSVDAFIAVSRFCARSMKDYLQLPEERIRVVPLGITTDGHLPSERPPGDPYTVGYLARVAPEKGLSVLAEAYRRMRGREDGPGDARLRAAGYLGPEHRSYFEKVRTDVASWGLADEFEYCGEPDRPGKLLFLRSLDVLSVPAPYAEPKGIFLLEAMASGVPVVQPRHGAFTEIVETTGGGLLVEPGDPDALAGALTRLWNDADLRRELGRRGSAGVREHYDAAKMAGAAAEVYRELLD